MADDPVQVKFECKEVDPCENSRAVHISPCNPGTVTDVEKVRLMRIESRPWTFHRPRLCVTPLGELTTLFQTPSQLEGDTPPHSLPPRRLRRLSLGASTRRLRRLRCDPGTRNSTRGTLVTGHSS